MEALVIKLRTNESPHGGVLRGYRVLLATPNLDGRKFNGAWTVSFAPKYLVYQSLDIQLPYLDEFIKQVLLDYKDYNIVTVAQCEAIAQSGELMRDNTTHKEIHKESDNES